jgi:hypothetical protein
MVHWARHNSEGFRFCSICALFGLLYCNLYGFCIHLFIFSKVVGLCREQRRWIPPNVTLDQIVVNLYHLKSIHCINNLLTVRLGSRDAVFITYR